jgi:cell division protein FtsI/penicillin-binding protein 2
MNYSAPTLSGPRSLVVSGTLILVLIALAVRLVSLQAAAHTQFDERALRQHGRVETLAARPGDLLDARGRLLATSVDASSAFVDPAAIHADRRPEVAASLALALDMDAVELQARIESNAQRRFLWIKRRLTDSEARAVRDLKWPAHWVGLRAETQRCYPQGPLASHVVGVRDIDGMARDGIERVFDPVLRGREGQRVVARDARGKTLAVHEHLTHLPEAGSSVVLTIDSVIQSYVEGALDRVVKQWKPVSATAIVMDPHNGDVLALANRPAFDLDNPATASADAWVNRAVSDNYEPGSTFKPFIMAAAIDWGLVDPAETIDCHGGVYRMGPRLLHSHHPNGPLSVPDVMIRSDNIGMAIIGERMTNAGLLRAVESFGFGRPTGIELLGESAGVVRPLYDWTDFYSTGSVPMGQEVATTPIQLIAAFCALANGGDLLRPRLVRAVVGPDGKRLQVFDKPELVGRPVSKQTARFMVETVLRGVVDRGTGRRAQLADYTVFGKTGTAQKQAEAGGYAPGRHVSSFIAGAPTGHPEAVVLVVVNDPTVGKDHYGGEVAGLAVAEILQKTLAYLRVSPDR